MRPVIKDPEAEKLLNELVEISGCGNASIAICMMVRRFAPSLIQWWKSELQLQAQTDSPELGETIKTFDPGENLPPLEL